MNDRPSDQPRSKNARQPQVVRSKRSRPRSNGLAEAPTSYRNGADGANSNDPISGAQEAKAERARARGRIQLFLSHKSRDQRAAEEVYNVLKRAGGRMLEIFMCENVEKGDDWQNEIEKQLHGSDWFLLLFSGNNDDDWSWCHHEAGFFRGTMYPDPKGVVVFYPSNVVSIPDPLKTFQAVKCNGDDLEEIYRFFNDLYAEDPYPGFEAINEFFASEQNPNREQDAKIIADAVGSLVIKSITQQNTMVIHVPDHTHLSKQTLFPAETRILAGSGALRLFDLGYDGDFLWAEFQDALSEEFRTCLKDSFWAAILTACSESIRSRRLASTHAILRSPVDGRNYAPILNRVEISGNNSAAFHITFVQIAAGTQAVVRDKSVARIFTALNLAHRFRWEIIDPYRDLDRLQGFIEHRARTVGGGGNGAGAGNGGGGLLVIWEAIRLLEIESLSRGVYDEEELPADFGPAAEGRVREMFPLWRENREQLERAARDRDPATFARVLAELDPVNVEFISLAAERLGELVRADAHTGHGDSQPPLTPAA